MIHGEHTYKFKDGSEFKGVFKKDKPISGQYTYENNNNLSEILNFQYKGYNVIVTSVDYSITYAEEKDKATGETLPS